MHSTTHNWAMNNRESNSISNTVIIYWTNDYYYCNKEWFNCVHWSDSHRTGSTAYILSTHTSVSNWIIGDIYFLVKFVNERQHSQTHINNLCPDTHLHTSIPHTYPTTWQTCIQTSEFIQEWFTDSQIYCRSSFYCSIFTSIDAKEIYVYDIQSSQKTGK